MNKILFVIVFLPILSSAQINESDTLNVKASLSLTGFFQKGNVQTKIFRGKVDLSLRPWDKWVFKTTNSYVYQEFGNEKADEDILSLNFLYFNPHKKIYPQILGFVSTNFRREIELRYLMGAGVTYQMLNGENSILKVSVTSEYEQTDFAKVNFNKDEYDGNETIRTLRGTIWVNGRYNLINKKIVLTHESYFQPSLESSRNYRWQADIGIELPLVKFVNFKINYIHTFESVVIENQKKEDVFLTFGLILKNF